MHDGSIPELEAELARERQALGQSLDRLSASLSPSRLKEQVSTAANEYGREIGTQVWNATRENPAAFALVGAGLALLFSGAGRRAENDAIAEPAAVPPDEAMEGFDQRVAQADAAMRKQQTGRSSLPSALHLRASLDRGLDKLPPAARQRVIAARMAAVRAHEAVERRASELASRSADAVRGNPILAGAAAFGVAALVGALLPGTRREDALLGDKRDALMAEARSVFEREMLALRRAATGSESEFATDRRPPAQAARS